MDEIRTELDHLEDDLEAFLRVRVEPGLTRALNARLAEQARDIAARADAQGSAQARELRALTQAVEGLRTDLSRLGERMNRLEKRAAREEGDRTVAVGPRRANALQGHREPEPTRPIRASLGRSLRDNIEYVTIGAVAIVVVAVVVWVVFLVNAPPKDPPRPAPVVAETGAAETPAAEAPAAGSPVVAPNPTDLGLTELVKRSDAVRALCAGRTCAFADLWPALTPAQKRALLTVAAEQVARPCSPRPAATLEADWRAALACAKDKPTGGLGAPAEEEAAARWLLTRIGARP